MYIPYSHINDIYSIRITVYGGQSTRDSPSIPHISLYQPMTNPTVQTKPNQIKPNPNRTQAWVSLEWFNPIQPFPL